MKKERDFWNCINAVRSFDTASLSHLGELVYKT